MLGDAIKELRKLPSESVHCVVTSPPYWGLRDYSRCSCAQGTSGDSREYDPTIPREDQWGGRNAGGKTPSMKREPDPNCPICHGTGIIEGVKDHQIGLEKTGEEYVLHLVEVFREVKRVLRDDGTLWLNLGDSYASESKGTGGPSEKQLSNAGSRYSAIRLNHGLKQKDLVGIPWRVAFALQADGWYLRSDIIWSKPNPMPESVRDRPTKSHEYIFMLTKSARYFWDQEAVRENYKTSDDVGRVISGFRDKPPDANDHSAKGKDRAEFYKSTGRNIRSVWEIATQPYPEAHFATFPEELPRRCIKAGTSQKGCCAKCGAPWERIVERKLNPSASDYNQMRKSVGSDTSACRNADEQYVDNLHRNDGGVYATAKSLGWQPTCECGAEIVPCVVLDPFAGSGTTGWVARSLGRKAILIELNPVYGQLIADRTKSDVPDIMAFGQGGEVGA